MDNHLAALLTLALLQLTMHPMMMGCRLLPVLPYTHIPIRWLAGQLILLIHNGNAILMSH